MNIHSRMSFDCLAVFAHATGRILVLPPPYRVIKQGFDEGGFEFYFDIDLFKSHRGTRVMAMKEFLQLEGTTGRLGHRGSFIHA